MLDRNTEIRVLGRGGQFYRISDGPLKILRQFGYYEVKHIPLYELEALMGTPGGEDLIRNYLVVEKKGLDALGIEVEPEYFYDQKIIKDILFSGNLAKIEDTLEFGNDAVKELVCRVATKEKVYDTRVLELIKEKTGCDIVQSMKISEMSQEPVKQEKKQRKVSLEEPKKKKTKKTEPKAKERVRQAPKPKEEDLNIKEEN